MFPMLPFAIGLLTGAVTVRLLKSANLRSGLDKAQDRLRDATVSGLSAIEHSSAELKAKLTTATSVVAEPAAAAPEGPAETSETAAPPRKPARKRAAAAGSGSTATPRRRAKASAKDGDAA